MRRACGYERLWHWFGPSRASFLVLPRVLMHEMPDAWQDRMAGLLEEYDQAYPNQPDLATYVSARHENRFVKFPSWVTNYRYPEFAEIMKLKPKKAA